MENIKKVVENEEWQTLRRSMEGTWISQINANKNLLKLKRYLNNTKNENKLRRVHNYLGALRGIHYFGIAELRNDIKRKRLFISKK